GPLTRGGPLERHRGMVDALEADPEPRRDLSRLTHHACAAGDAAAVLRYAPRAAERASSLGAYREAAAHYASALRFADQATVEQRADLLERQSLAFYFMDDQPAALAALSQPVDHH